MTEIELLKREFDSTQQPIQTEVQMTAPGVFEITATPGKYELRMQQRNGGPSRSSEVEISQNNQELDASAGQAGSTISATARPPVPIHRPMDSSPASFIAALRLSIGAPKLTPSTTIGAWRSIALAEFW